MIPVEQLTAGAEAHRKNTRRPLVTVSYAQSLDGSITSERGKKLKLSGKRSIEITHKLRAVHDAILVGIETVLADDPQLTVRYAQGDNPQPVILDSHLRIPINAQLFKAQTQAIILSGNAKGKKEKKKTDLIKRGAQIFADAFKIHGINLRKSYP